MLECKAMDASALVSMLTNQAMDELRVTTPPNSPSTTPPPKHKMSSPSSGSEVKALVCLEKDKARTCNPTHLFHAA